MGFFKRFFSKFLQNDHSNKDLKTLEKDMIQGVVDLSDTTVREIMIPRIDTVFLASDISTADLMNIIIENGYSRYPVYEETIDHVIGILYVKDTLKFIYNNQKIDIKKIVRKAYFVPESKRIDSLLVEFKKRRVHIAVAVDEYGGVSGIVSMEDIIEEIVGDIQDEFDDEVEDIMKVSEGVFLCDARVNLEELSDALGIPFPLDDFDTLGGFVFDLFGRIPLVSEKVSYNGYDFIIQEMDHHKIQLIKIIKVQVDKIE